MNKALAGLQNDWYKTAGVAHTRFPLYTDIVSMQAGKSIILQQFTFEND